MLHGAIVAPGRFETMGISEMHMFKSLVGTAALTFAAIASPAFAACGPDLKVKSSFDGGTGAHAQVAAFEPGSIVGLWDVTFYDKSDNVVDFGYVAWHEDGTEIMNSGGRSPASENFCLGVYKQTGNRRYKLNHYALGYDPSTGALAAKVGIVENVTVDETGNKYDGPFTMTVTDPTGKPLQRITGMVVGKRLIAQ